MGIKKEHIRVIHEKLKKFQCEHCEKAFGQKSNLRNHVKNIHGGKKMKCDFCDKFLFQYSMKRHIESAHKQRILHEA